MSMSCLKNDTVLTWQKLHRRKVKSLQSGCGHLPAELIFSPASLQAKLRRQYRSRLKRSLWHLKNIFPSPPEFSVRDYTQASWRQRFLPSLPTYFPSRSRYSQTIGANPLKLTEEWGGVSKRKEVEISGVDVQQDGERPTNMSSSEQKRQRVLLHTYLFGGEFDQGSFVALKERKEEASQVWSETLSPCREEVVLMKASETSPGFLQKSGAESSSDALQRCCFGTDLTQMATLPSHAQRNWSLTWLMHFWTDCSKIKVNSWEDVTDLQGYLTLEGF